MWEYNHYNDPPREDELYHFGIKGQKWGLRRFQNEDGSLTPEGKKRYGSVENLNAARAKRASRLKKAAIAAGAVAGAAALGYGAYKGINALKARNAAQAASKVQTKPFNGKYHGPADAKMTTYEAPTHLSSGRLSEGTHVYPNRAKVGTPGANSVYGGGTSTRNGLQSIISKPGSNSVYGGGGKMGFKDAMGTYTKAAGGYASKAGNAIKTGANNARSGAAGFWRGLTNNGSYRAGMNPSAYGVGTTAGRYVRKNAVPLGVAAGTGAGVGVGVGLATRRRKKKK